jgi:hypothetical protein
MSVAGTDGGNDESIVTRRAVALHENGTYRPASPDRGRTAAPGRRLKRASQRAPQPAKYPQCAGEAATRLHPALKTEGPRPSAALRQSEPFRAHYPPPGSSMPSRPCPPPIHGSGRIALTQSAKDGIRPRSSRTCCSPPGSRSRPRS